MAMQPQASRVTSAVASRLPAVADLCAKHRVRRLALFGSGATGEFDAQTGSDLDFLAEFSPMSPRDHAESYFGLMEDLQRLLGVPVDLVEAGASRNPYFQEAVRNTQVVLLRRPETLKYLFDIAGLSRASMAMLLGSGSVTSVE